jgi:hypothetical protein
MPNTVTIKNRLQQNSQVIDIFSVEDLIEAWERTTSKRIAHEMSSTARVGANYASAILDSHTVVKMVKELGVDGKVILKTVKGRQYVVFKGYAGKRSIFTTVRYLASNPKVVDMAIGKVGVNQSIISGARITIFLVVPINVLNYILDDHKTMAQLIGETATDLVKIGVAAAVVSLLATATATLTTLAAGPLVVAIVAGLAVAYGLDALDKKFGVTNALVKALNDARDKTIGEMKRQFNQVERRLKWQVENGEPVGQGVFY